MVGILVVGHGSRSIEAQETFNRVIEMLRELSGDNTIQGAHMELCSPSVEESVATLVNTKKEIKEIRIIPYFLYSGIHIKEDIPEIIEELEKVYPNIVFKFGNPLGAEIEIAKILHKRVIELQ